MSDSDDVAIEQALSQAMATGNEPRLVQGGEGANASQVREYTELLGLLPYELEPEVPTAELKGRVMARVRAAANEASRAELPDGVEAFPQRVSAPVAAASRSWGNFALAAMFAACLIGLGFTAGLAWQQGQQIDRLSSELAQAPLVSVSNPSPAAGLRTDKELEMLRDRLEMITVIARQAYPLRRVSHQASGQSSADGIVYVCGQHQRWYLNLQGLEPAGNGEEYRLWFMTDDGKIDGGILVVGQDRSIEKDSLSMPPGTHGFAVTREGIGPRNEPESLTILLGEQAINL